MSLLAFREVSKRYPDGTREIVVLGGVSFELEQGETVGVLAARRAGKTTLLRLAAGLELPDSGTILWDGQDLTRTGSERRVRFRRRGGIALAVGDWRTGDSVPVLEHLALPLYSNGLTMDAAEGSARRALECVQAPHLGYRATGELSLSERMRVELARAIAHEPRLLLIDEPAILAQPSEAHAFYELLRSLPAQLGLALVVASEDLAPLAGTRVLHLDNGRLYSTDSRRKVLPFPERRAGNDG